MPLVTFSLAVALMWTGLSAEAGLHWSVSGPVGLLIGGGLLWLVGALIFVRR